MTPNGWVQMDRIYGDRRANRRYGLNLQLRYKVTRGKRLIEMGSGQTLDISSGGVSFSTGQLLPPGAFAELWLEWPIPLDGNALRLVMQGRIIRSETATAAVQISRHEFRLAGARAAGASRQGNVYPIASAAEAALHATEP
jgi:hypothetical protein